MIVSGEFRYFGVESSITRPPKPMILFRMSMMGNMSRLRNRSYTPPFLPRRESPASTSSSSLYPFSFIASVSSAHAFGLKPSPKRLTVSMLSARFCMYACASVPTGENSCWRKNRAASLHSAQRRSCFWYCER